jgi:filamentous hemagglutinin family protein
MIKGFSALQRALLLGSMLTPLAASPTLANPQGGRVVVGSAAITGGAGATVVRQSSNRSVINWQSFSISTGETVRFNLPSAQAAVLNRVTGAQMSSLMGALSSNGQVYLLNPNGVVVGPNGKVVTAGFVASTLDLSNDQFMQGGSQTFKGQSGAGIVILGTVKADGGDVLLAAAQVENQGQLLAPGGRVILSAGSELIYVPGQSGNISILAPAPTPASGAEVSNTGVIEAAHVQLAAAGSAYALAVNNGGQISAIGVSNVGGHVVLDGGAGDVVDSGAISSHGGAVSLTGGRVALTGDALIDVSAASGGGEATLAAANAIEVDAGASIKADATTNCDGGSISIKTAGATQFAGAASAEGGLQGGNGGSAEISGGSLGFTGTVSLLAPKGKAGTLLFDPTAIDVVSGSAATPSGVSGGLWSFASDTGSQTISVGAIESLLASANLELQASNSITFDTPGTGAFATLVSNSGKTLTLTAPTITVNASISLPNGTLVFNWPDADIAAHGIAQSVISASSAAITAHALTIAGNYDQVALGGPVTAGTLSFTEPSFAASSITINNAANAISAVSFDPGGSNSAQLVDVESSTAMTVSGNVQNANSVTLVAGGDLTLQSGFSVSQAAFMTFASTGGVFDNLAGSGAVNSPNGKLRIYSSTNGVGASGVAFNDNGLGSGATILAGVSYPSNPDTIDPVVEYFVTTSAEPTLVITANSFSRLYGQPDPTFTASYSGGHSGGASELTTLPAFRVLQGVDVNAGLYTIEPFGAASSVDLLRYVDGTLDVNPAPLTISAHPASMTYGGSVPTFSDTISGFVNGDTASIVSGVSVTSNAPASPPAGAYVITPSGATVATPVGGAEPNYTIAYQTAAFTVNPAPLTVTASAASAVYGGAIPNFSLSFSGLVNAADAASVPKQFAAITNAIVGSGVGSYPITLATADPDSNYTVTYVGANLTITTAALTITPNLTKVYGAALPANLPGSDFSGFVAGDSSASLTVQPTLTTAGSNVGSNVGSYGITASGAVDPNYTITYAPGVLSITPAPLLITAQNASRGYGSANPAFTAGYSGLVNGDASSVVTGLAFSTTATSASNVGAYAIVPSGGSASNYTISYASGALSITPISLLIVPVGSSVYGTDPAKSVTVTYNASGFVNGDSLARLTTQPSFTTPATNASNVGSYTLLALGAADPNYVIHYGPGVLTVTPARVTVTPDDASMVYGTTPPSVGVTASGLVNGDTLGKVFGSIPVVSVPDGKPAGVYATFVEPQNTIDNDYVAVFTTASLLVTPAPLTITPNLTLASGQAPPAVLPASDFSRLVNGDTPSSLTLQPQVTISSEGLASVVTASGAFDPNYDISYKQGQITTLLATLTPPPILTNLNPAPPAITLSLAGEAPLEFGRIFGSFGAEAYTIANELGAASNPPLAVYDIGSALKNPSTSAAMWAQLVPFMMDDLSGILNLPQSSWTPSQAAFVQAMLDYINAQRIAAAQQAEADYEAWGLQQQKALSDKLNYASNFAEGQLAVIQNAALDPPVPPTSLLAEVTAGFTMTDSQANSFMQAMNYANAATGVVVATGAVTSGSLIFAQVGSVFEGKNGNVAFSLAKAASNVGMALTVVEVAANLAQIGLSSASYAQAAIFNADFQNAVNAAYTPLTANDLKGMFASNGGQQKMAIYLTAYGATGVPDQFLNPLGQTPTMSLNAIEQLSQTI